jgi:uncharacterized membrane protein
MHMKRHHSGQDLTAEIGAAPHDIDVLDRFPQVGILVEEPAVPAESPSVIAVPGWLERFLERHPFYQRHPHPMTVHFPIVFFMSAPLFMALYLITDLRGFEVTVLHCLGAGIFFSFIAIPTGLLTWWLNYGARPMPAVTVKLTVSITEAFLAAVAFVWRLADPSLASELHGLNLLYPALVFLLLPMILVVGWFGATLTFPLRARARRSAGQAPGAGSSV